MSNGIILCVVAGIIACGWMRHVNLYDAFVKGAREGLQSAVHILPNLMAMLMGIHLLGASGLLTGLESLLTPLLRIMGLPSDTAPLLLLRPFSGSGALAMLTEIMETAGADSRAGLVASTIMGSSETIIYALGIYGAAGKVNGFRYALPVALAAWFISCGAAGLFYP